MKRPTDEEMRAAGWISARDCLPVVEGGRSPKGRGWSRGVLITDCSYIEVGCVRAFGRPAGKGRPWTLAAEWSTHVNFFEQPTFREIEPDHWWRPLPSLFKPLAGPAG